MIRTVITLLIICMGFSSCREGDTRDIYELVRAADLGIVSFTLIKSHADNLRPGREISIKAIALLEDGGELDLTNEVNWLVPEDAVIRSNGGGYFEALSVPKLTKTSVEAEFAGLISSVEIWVSNAPLESLVLGFAAMAIDTKYGIESQCQIDPENIEMSQCSAKRLCLLGAYEGESELREETLYAEFTGSQNSIFDLGYIVNSQIDLESGDLQEQVLASLDSLNSNSLEFVHKQNLSQLSISSVATHMQMGSSLLLDIESISERVKNYAVWSFTSLELGQPEADGDFKGLAFRAAHENEYVENFSEYGVNIQASCSGKASNQVQILIESDVDQLTIVDSLVDKEIIIGSNLPTILTLNATNVAGDQILIKNGEVSWFVCGLADSFCTEDDRQANDGAVLSFIADVDAEPETLRIEAVFHGKKVVREDFSLIAQVVE